MEPVRAGALGAAASAAQITAPPLNNVARTRPRHSLRGVAVRLVRARREGLTFRERERSSDKLPLGWCSSPSAAWFLFRSARFARPASSFGGRLNGHRTPACAQPWPWPVVVADGGPFPGGFPFPLAFALLDAKRNPRMQPAWTAFRSTRGAVLSASARARAFGVALGTW